jgi:anti-sigma B factor antagonist
VGTEPNLAHAVTYEPGRAYMVLTGELDAANANALKKAGRAAIHAGPNDLLIDFSAVAFCDSTGLSALVHLHQLAKAHGRTMRVVNANGIIIRVFTVTGLLQVLTGGELAETVSV